jgi:hypothetical protein
MKDVMTLVPKNIVTMIIIDKNYTANRGTRT